MGDTTDRIRERRDQQERLKAAEKSVKLIALQSDQSLEGLYNQLRRIVDLADEVKTDIASAKADIESEISKLDEKDSELDLIIAISEGISASVDRVIESNVKV